MNTESKVFLMGLALFLGKEPKISIYKPSIPVLGALLQSLYELLEPQLLSLPSSPSASRGRHMRCLVLSGILFIASIAMASSILTYLPLDLW